MLTKLAPIFKSKTVDITSIGIYRPIVLATVCFKIVETCLVSRLESYLYTNDNQFAYKRGHSTDMCIYLLKEEIRFYTKCCSPVYACFLDASKAFDILNHWVIT